METSYRECTVRVVAVTFNVNDLIEIPSNDSYCYNTALIIIFCALLKDTHCQCLASTHSTISSYTGKIAHTQLQYQRHCGYLIQLQAY